MAVRQEKGGKWAAYNNRQKRYRGGFATRAEAEAFDARHRAASSGHIDHTRGKRALGVSLDEWLEHIDGLRSQRTVAAARWTVEKRVPDFIKSKRVDRLTRQQLQAWVDDMTREGLTGSTVRRYFAPVKTACEWLVREGVLLDNPAKGVQQPKQRRDAPNPFTDGEFTELVESIRETSPEAALLVWFMGDTGCRPGEATNLRVRDLQRLPHHAIRVQTSKSEGFDEKTTKTGEWRTVRLRSDLAAALVEVSEGKGADDLLLTTPRGSRWRDKTFRRLTRWTDLAAGHRPYDLRHTAACRWLLAGFAPTTVQHWLGHESLAMTSHYLRFLGIESDAAAQEWLVSAPAQTHAGEKSVRTTPMGGRRK